jgi:hypothetical protein
MLPLVVGWASVVNENSRLTLCRDKPRKRLVEGRECDLDALESAKEATERTLTVHWILHCGFAAYVQQAPQH